MESVKQCSPTVVQSCSLYSPGNFGDSGRLAMDHSCSFLGGKMCILCLKLLVTCSDHFNEANSKNQASIFMGI